MRKVKILITGFIIMLILSMDLGAVFSDTAKAENEVQATADEPIFKFSNLQHNVGCITSAIGGAFHAKVAGAANDTAEKYANAVADATTKNVEKAIIEKKQEKKEKNK